MNSTSIFLPMLLTTSPLLLVYIVALVMAITFWANHPQTCALVLGGAIILLLVTLIQPILQQQMLNSVRTSGQSMQSYGQLASVVGIIANILRAGGIGLFVWAAFSGRTSAAIPTAIRVMPPRPPGSPFGQ